MSQAWVTVSTRKQPSLTSANYIRQIRLNALMSQVTVPLRGNLPVHVVQRLCIGQQHRPGLFRMVIF